MSNILNEQLSAFLDGELPPEEIDLLLERLDRDGARRAMLGRYAMIGECIRTGSVSPAALDVADRVRVAIAAEAGGAVTPRAGPGHVASWAGGALAASVVVALLWAVQGNAPPAQPEAVVSAAVVPDAGVSANAEGLNEVYPRARRRLAPQAAARLTDYLMAHGEYANVISRNNFDSRLVSARAERASWQQSEGLADAR